MPATRNVAADACERLDALLDLQPITNLNPERLRQLLRGDPANVTCGQRDRLPHVARRRIPAVADRFRADLDRTAEPIELLRPFPKRGIAPRADVVDDASGGSRDPRIARQIPRHQ